MARRPATLSQAEIARTIRAAKQTGAREVEVRVSRSIWGQKLLTFPNVLTDQQINKQNQTPAKRQLMDG